MHLNFSAVWKLLVLDLFDTFETCCAYTASELLKQQQLLWRACTSGLTLPPFLDWTLCGSRNQILASKSVVININYTKLSLLKYPLSLCLSVPRTNSDPNPTEYWNK